MRGLFFFQFDGPKNSTQKILSSEMATTLTALLLRRGKKTIIKSEFRCCLSRSFASSSSSQYECSTSVSEERATVCE
jgi:hypothetical protein